MLIEIDFNSEEALYVQLQNQIIMGIAMDLIKEGDALPSVRQLADTVGINMHTVNKAYTVLKQEIQRPVKWAGRFSKKAAVPSFRSSVLNAMVCARRSSIRPVLRSLSAPY